MTDAIYTGTGGVGFGDSAIVSVQKVWIGSGGLEVSGTADYFKPYLPAGGFSFGGSLTQYSGTVSVSYEFESSGGLRFYGAALSNFSRESVYKPNILWDNLSTGATGEFLYSRLTEQKNPLAAYDMGPVNTLDTFFSGDPIEENFDTLWGAYLDTSDASIKLKNIATDEDTTLLPLSAFSITGLRKLDLTFDYLGYLTLLLVADNGETMIFFYDADIATFNLVEISEDVATAFCCNTERRFPGTAEYARTFVVLQKEDGQILYTSFADNKFQILRETDVEIPEGTSVELIGLGQVDSSQLQLRLRYVYEG